MVCVLFRSRFEYFLSRFHLYASLNLSYSFSECNFSVSLRSANLFAQVFHALCLPPQDTLQPQLRHGSPHHSAYLYTPHPPPSHVHGLQWFIPLLVQFELSFRDKTLICMHMNWSPAIFTPLIASIWTLLVACCDHITLNVMQQVDVKLGTSASHNVESDSF